MTQPPIPLAVEKDYGFQCRAWVVERVGWSLIALLLLAAALGAFGRGPLSRAYVEGEGVSPRLEYERCLRFEAPTELRVRAQPHATAGALAISIPRSYWNDVAVREVLPPPSGVQLRGDEVVYQFLVDPGTRDAEILFRIKPQRIGPSAGWLAVGDTVLPFRQFVFP